MTENMIRTRSELKDWIRYEKNRYPSFSRIAYLFQASELAVLWKHQILLRKTEYHKNSNHKIMYMIMKLMLGRVQTRYCLHIPPNTCGKGLRIMHLGPILINSRVRIGENCSLHINTAFVAGGTNDDVPTLGKNIVVGVGATILGNTHIADGVAIGANAVVNRDVLEPDIAVAGVPAKKISNNGNKNWGKSANKQ